MEETTDESATSYPVPLMVVVVVVVVVVLCANPYDDNRHRIPAKKEYFLLAITID